MRNVRPNYWFPNVRFLGGFEADGGGSAGGTVAGGVAIVSLTAVVFSELTPSAAGGGGVAPKDGSSDWLQLKPEALIPINLSFGRFAYSRFTVLLPLLPEVHKVGAPPGSSDALEES